MTDWSDAALRREIAQTNNPQMADAFRAIIETRA